MKLTSILCGLAVVFMIAAMPAFAQDPVKAAPQSVVGYFRFLICLNHSLSPSDRVCLARVLMLAPRLSTFRVSTNTGRTL